jgi:hypothetical protein
MAIDLLVMGAIVFVLILIGVGFTIIEFQKMK